MIDVLTSSPDILGECPLYDAATDTLYRVDITGRALRARGIATGDEREWPVPLEPGSVALRAGGGLVLALEDALWSLDPATGAVAKLVDITGGDGRVALNDGRCDAAGRFWVGSYDRAETAAIGCLYVVDVDGAVTTALTGVTVGNGVDWSPDGSVAYFTDSAGEIVAMDVRDGVPGPPRRFAYDDDCSPDGLVVDAEGYVWSTKWDGWRIVRYAPDGRVDRTIELPVQRPTAATFGGPALDTLYVTTATYGLDAAARAAQPLAGLVLAVDVGVSGRPATPYGG